MEGIDMGKKIIVVFVSSYISGGSFYDNFEYYVYMKKNGYDVEYMVMVDGYDREGVMEVLRDKYDVGEDIYSGVVVREYIEREKIYVLRDKYDIVFSTSDYSIYDMHRKSRFYIPCNKIVCIHDAPIGSRQYEYVNSLNNCVVLSDWRVYGEVGIDYRRKMYMDIHRVYDEWEDKVCINDYTMHKMVDEGIMKEIKGRYDKLFIYGREDRDIDGVEYVKAPVFQFHKKFGKALYINSNRGFDCSPRILVECVYMGKGIEIYDREGLESLKDGGYWRVRDIEEGIDGLMMKSGDDILKIIDEI